MKKVEEPHEPDEENYIFTEGINYFDVKGSVWGEGDPETLELLKETEINGKWLNLAAGDGRYNDILLEKADQVVASDIDKGALSKLYHRTPEDLKGKLYTEIFDITERFPFEDNSFDGVLCTGTLHFFDEKTLKEILNEIDRVLKANGIIIIDFATDIRRVKPDGSLYVKKNEELYSTEEAIEILKESLGNYSLNIQKCEVQEERFETEDMTYDLNCNFILLKGRKSKGNL